MTRTELLQQIATNDTIAVSALIALYGRQTADEQTAETTAHSNGVGFNGTDAGILSSFAKQAIEWRAAKKAGQAVRFASPLSPRQMELLRKKLPKYARQLEEIAEEKAARRAAASRPEPGERPDGEVQGVSEATVRSIASTMAANGASLRECYEVAAALMGRAPYGGQAAEAAQASEDAAFDRIFGPDRFEREQMARRDAERLPLHNGFDVPPSVVEQARATVPGFDTADGAYVTEGFVYTPDGVIFHRNGAKAVSKAVGEKFGHCRRPAQTLQADPMDEFFA
jgi:hypothetical protein